VAEALRDGDGEGLERRPLVHEVEEAGQGREILDAAWLCVRDRGGGAPRTDGQTRYAHAKVSTLLAPPGSLDAQCGGLAAIEQVDPVLMPEDVIASPS